MKGKLLAITLLIFLSGLLTTYALYQGWLRFNYPSYQTFPIQGIDIAHHQGVINWEQLKEEPISFAFIKATEGGDFKDPKFLDNWKQARTIGLTVSAYHFYRFCKTGTEQAQNFIATVPKAVGTLPPVIDLEFGANCGLQQSKKQILQGIETYIQLVEQHLGIRN